MEIPNREPTEVYLNLFDLVSKNKLKFFFSSDWNRIYFEWWSNISIQFSKSTHDW